MADSKPERNELTGDLAQRILLFPVVHRFIFIIPAPRKAQNPAPDGLVPLWVSNTNTPPYKISCPSQTHDSRPLALTIPSPRRLTVCKLAIRILTRFYVPEPRVAFQPTAHVAHQRIHVHRPSVLFVSQKGKADPGTGGYSHWRIF